MGFGVCVWVCVCVTELSVSLQDRGQKRTLSETFVLAFSGTCSAFTFAHVDEVSVWWWTKFLSDYGRNKCVDCV